MQEYAMILDDLSNLVRYSCLHRLFPVVSDFLFSHDVSGFEPGTVSIGNGISLITSTYSTDTGIDRYLECHRKFIDLQMALDGSEEIGFAPSCFCRTQRSYDDQKDLELVQGSMDRITLRKSLFVLFFPGDAHLPGLAPGGVGGNIRKLVVKIPV